MQKLIVATVVAQARIEAKEEAEEAKVNQIQEAMRSIPEIEALMRKLEGKGRRSKPQARAQTSKKKAAKG